MNSSATAAALEPTPHALEVAPHPLSPRVRRPPRRWRAAPRRHRAVDMAAGLAGIGLGLTVALGVSSETLGDLQAPGGALTAAGRMTGLIGSYMFLIAVLLAGRIPFVERTLGQDRLTRWHRLLAPWALVLIAAHGTLITAGYAQTASTGLLHQFGTLLDTYPGILTATGGFVLLVFAGFTSARIARRRMKYETWWAIHLYTYLALALSFSHQLATGAPFISNPAARVFWTALWIGTAGVVLTYRVLLPVWRSIFHQFQVVAVHREGPDVVSVVLSGRHLHRLPISGGQFCQVRVLKRGLWWQAHPYSVSALPSSQYLRFTIRELGDHSGALAALEPGTRVAIEGPYGAFTADSMQTDRAALIGAGVGVTPLRALLEDLPRHVDTVLVARATDSDELLLGEELRTLIDHRGGQMHELLGPRHQARLDPQALRDLIPDITKRDLFVCGPPGFTTMVRRSAQALGVPPERVHHEEFAF